jgi:hypothetical protein
LVCIGSLDPGSGDHKIPSPGKNSRAAESLPELDVEIPACILSADYTRHHKPIRHAPIIALKSDAL